MAGAAYFDSGFVWGRSLGSPSTPVSPRAADALPAHSEQPLFIGGSLHGAVSFGAKQLEAGLDFSTGERLAPMVMDGYDTAVITLGP